MLSCDTSQLSPGIPLCSQTVSLSAITQSVTVTAIHLPCIAGCIQPSAPYPTAQEAAELLPPWWHLAKHPSGMVLPKPATRPAPGDFLKVIYSNFGDDLEISLPKCTNDIAVMLKLCLSGPSSEQPFLHALSFILVFLEEKRASGKALEVLALSQ